jgi:quercetin dioxygenase-like cupin family protein
MRMLLAGVALVAATMSPAGVVLDNARVRVFKESAADAIRDHPAAVIVVLEDGPAGRAGDAYWSADAAASVRAVPGADPVIVIEPKDTAPAAMAAPPPAATNPGEGVFTGMSFTPLFENARVAVIRGRMAVGATEGFHTHASDVVLVHLSGGRIEDTANGITKVNRWRHGDVEFEARGSSHSARNLGPAVGAVLVTLKP